MTNPIDAWMLRRQDRRQLLRLGIVERAVPGLTLARTEALTLLLELMIREVRRLRAASDRPVRELRMRHTLDRLTLLLAHTAHEPLTGHRLRRIKAMTQSLLALRSTRRLLTRQQLDQSAGLLNSAVSDLHVGVPNTPEQKIFLLLVEARDRRLLDPAWTLAWLVLSAKPDVLHYDVTTGSYPALVGVLLRARATARRLDVADVRDHQRRF